jgi:hypothetical protein
MKTSNQLIVFSRWSLPIGIIIFSSFMLQSSALRAQLVVPKGWENMDSVRFGLFGIEEYGNTAINRQADSLADSVGCNLSESFGDIGWNDNVYGHRKGFLARNIGGADTTFIDVVHLASVFQQRIYYADSVAMPLFGDWGYYWRYNDLRFNRYARLYNNTYDSNDISIYAEYPRKDSIASLSYLTHQFDSTGYTSGSTVTVGNQGRVILGYSNNCLADQLLRTSNNYYFPQKTTRDTAKTFSATVEFNIDTSSIDTLGSSLGHDNVPLLRFQILYKQGETRDTLGHIIDTGWAVLPFVPFRDSSHRYNAGWYRIIDTTITYAVYKTLPDDWRKEDVLASGSLAHPLWHFKQLHVILKDMPQSMKNLMRLTSDDSARIAYGISLPTSGDTSFQNPDFIVAGNPGDTDGTTKSNYLLESRVLSTYRATVRVRSMTWQDTVVDNILWRKLDTLTHLSYSCNPKTGLPGGYDSLFNIGIQKIYDSCHAYGTQLREFEFNDVKLPFSNLSISAIGYADYMLSKKGMGTHIREQDRAGGQAEQLRREKLSYDGKPPAMYENQYNNFYTYAGSVPIFPSDYLLNGVSLNSALTWPNHQDTILHMVMGRQDTTADPLKAYKTYTDQCGGLAFMANILRASAYSCLRHPQARKYALEESAQGWAGLSYQRAPWDTTYDPNYAERPTTPEEIQAQFFIGLANGVSCFNNPQPYDAGGKTGGSPGLFGVRRRTNVNDTTDIWTNKYNFGHRNQWDTTAWYSPSSNELDIYLPQYYLGYANTFRAFKRTLGRINQIFDTTHGRNEIPFRRFTWLDTYSTSNSFSAGSDQTTKNNAFLKCYSTTPVKRWSRGSNYAYIDSLTADSSQRTYVEVGLFKDSINTKIKNYAALVVNTRLWPSLRDSVDIKYYNNGLDSAKDKSQSTLGDIDTRRVWLTIDTNQMDPASRSASYYVHDLWQPDSTWLVSNDTISVYIKPGDAKFLYLTPANGQNLGRLTDNLYNNGRHIAAIDTAAQGVKQYAVTYVRSGKVCVSYPVETPANADKRTVGTPVDSVIWIDTSGHAYNSSIAYNHKDSTIAITWRKVRPHDPINIHYPGSAYDTTLICFCRAHYYSDKYHFSPMTVLDTLISGVGYISPPAIAPRDTSYKISLRSSDFWVAYNCVDSGETLVLVDTNGAVTQRIHFWSPDRQFVYHKFVSIATHLPYDSVHIAFEEGFWGEGQIYYTKAYIDGTGALQVNTNPALCISSGLKDCENYNPQIGITKDNTLEVVWESVEKTPPPPDTVYLPGTQLLRHFAVLRTRGGIVSVGILPYSWSDYTTFLVNQRYYYAPIDSPYTPRLYVNVASGFYSPFSNIRRMTWNNLTTGSVELARFWLWSNGITGWLRYDFTDLSWEPAMPTLSFGNFTSDVFSYRGKVLHEDGHYDARVVRYLFPDNVAGNANGYHEILSFPDSEICNKQILNSKIGHVSVISTSTSSVKVIPFHCLSDSANDPHGTVPITWNDKKAVRTLGFTISYGDTLKYQRSFTVGEYQAGDTTALSDSLKGSTDYLLTRIYLRRAVNDSILAILDSARLKQSGFIQSASLHDSCFKRYYSIFSDSVYMTMEMSRGDTTNSFALTHIETYNDYFFGSPTPGDTLSYKTSASPVQQVSAPENPIKVSVIPNPFHTMATVSIDAPQDIPLNVTLFDELGRRVTELNNGPALQSHSEFTVTSQSLTSGFYFLRVQSGSQVVTRKIELVK